VPGLVTSLLLDLSPMRHTHTYGYSGLSIDGQIPGRISDVGDDSKLSIFRNGHLEMVKGEMTMNQGDGEKKENRMAKDTGRDGKAFFAGDDVL